MNIKWVNTNLLLNHGFDGFKTGITPTAGPWLIGTWKCKNNTELIIIVLNSKNIDIRWI